ncbi:hypothetical protein [Bordetella genomosp. 11]|uniref:Uncharacterized protein n=1 Tax=Bordetella genomosp. 11 TaxID=1416808 RepID=A0A261UKE6_9BORD|nr:hypothetical protein [Bordetella genomosp. 11]OZI62115.1 hypothetical protein CAL28_23100 [Bordetella genomosp. 11]
MSSGARRYRSRNTRVSDAYKIMQQVYERCQAAGESPQTTHLAIQAAYPWGERRRWPYKAWLIARREFYEAHGLPLRERRPIAEVIEEIAS